MSPVVSARPDEGVKANSADVYTKTETDAAIPVIYFAQVSQFGTIDRGLFGVTADDRPGDGVW